MMITYGVVEERHAQNGTERVSYGIAAYSDVQNNNTATILASVADVTDDKHKLTALVEQCNRLELSPVHLMEVVEDFLAH